MLCTLIDAPFDEKGWIFEIKWDGYRAFAEKNGSLKLISRGGKSYNARFPNLANEFEKIKGASPFIIDGEIVVFDKGGKSNFQKLQNYMREKKGKPYFYAFDLLMLRGKDLRHLPLIERKKRLKELICKLKYVRYSSHIFEKGISFFKKAEKKGLEGIIAKKENSTYQSKRTKNWLKIKVKNRQEMVIGGFTKPKGARKGFGALLIGVYQKKKLQYCGLVGGGFNRKLLEEIYADLKRSKSPNCPFEKVPKSQTGATWVKPKLVCEVEFTEWTKEGKLRHPIFKGMRIDKPAKKVVRE